MGLWENFLKTDETTDEGEYYGHYPSKVGSKIHSFQNIIGQTTNGLQVRAITKDPIWNPKCLA